MRMIETTLPKLGFAIATRAALAFGVGLLVSPRLSDDRRRTLGMSLIALGALTTIPAALALFGSRRDEQENDEAYDEGEALEPENGASAPTRVSIGTTEVPVF